MSELTVATRYAKSLIDLAQEQNIVEDIKNDMDLFHHTLRVNPELKAVLANPIVSHSKKIKILDDVFGTRVNKLSILFFKLMINKSRGEVLYTTAEVYVDMYDIKKHIVRAKVVSATALSAANKAKMIADIQAATGGTIKLDAKVDPSLIGGFVLTIGDRQVDTSIANDLRKLKKEFAQRVIAVNQN
jgi:F-type H+-transporting ATPase subunit delta